MKAWLCIPSARPAEEANLVLRLWRERGYGIALWRDDSVEPPICDVLLTDKYPGYANAVNALTTEVLGTDDQCDFVICAGDDTEPDPYNSAEEIARECNSYFFQRHWQNSERPVGETWATFGVMQPTGDRWTVNGPGTQPGIDLVAGSPWMGREFCRRINQGKGPLWPEYFHCGEDEELQEVATRLGVFWQRPDLIHFHNHWGRPRDGERIGQADRMPEFLKRANSPEEWRKFRKLFAERKAAGFPGSEPIP